MKTMILILVAALTMGGCMTNAAGSAPVDIRDREWTLVSVDGFTTLPSGVSTPTIRFGTDGRAGGNTACNSAGAEYTLDGDRLSLGRMMVTKRACLDPNGGRLESAYISAVEDTRSYRVNADGQLELLDESGKVRARFR